MSDLLFEYKVRARHRLSWKEFSFYATTDIEEFLNRNSIDYVRNMTDTVEHRQLKEIERLHSIIKEVREKCEEEIKEGRSEENTWLMGIYDNSKDILEILDKVDKENK